MTVFTHDEAVLITGGGSGIGRAMAREFAAEGARVAVLDRNGTAADETATGIGGSAIAIITDVSVQARPCPPSSRAAAGWPTPPRSTASRA